MTLTDRHRTFVYDLGTVLVRYLDGEPDPEGLVQGLAIGAAFVLSSLADSTAVARGDVECLIAGFCSAVREATWALVRSECQAEEETA